MLRDRDVLCPLSIALCSLALAGCYASHELERPLDEGGPETLDAALGPIPDDAAFPAVDAPLAPLDAGPACPLVEQVLDVPRAGCAALVVPSTLGNACGRGPSAAARVVRVRRERAGAPWSALIRSRSIDSGTIAYGISSPATCDLCEFQGSTTGADLRSHGVGGSLPDARELDIVLAAEGGGAMWLRVCDAGS